ncbi:hypothetical protein CCAX7_44720 [Capsulimonas corticalis]|uniref:Right handed beta helix domain-containing protein n=1 Tax=Capsulimonas corticalis TaxID=2219043 RepID=A0A9N7QD45_9BACT|nr:hypothetical protein CCAX7_44720 [Capsulimonas corticalis]
MTLYVSPHGNDAWTGRLAEPNKGATDGPLGTIESARNHLRLLRKQGALAGKAATVQVRGGVYFLTSPLTLTPEDSGTRDAPVVFEAFPGEKPVLSGGRRVTGWRKGVDGFWTTSLPKANAPWDFRQFFVNGARRPRPSLPSGGGYYLIAADAPSTRPKQGFDGFVSQAGDLNAHWRNLSDVDVLCYHIWSMSRMRIASMDELTNRVRFTGPTCSTDYWAGLQKGNRFRVENVFEALPKEPGSWYLDKAAGTVTYHPLPGENLRAFAPIVPRLTELVRFAGDTDKKQWVSGVTLRGITFEDADWTLAAEGYSCSQAEMQQPAVVTAVGTRDCQLENCEIAHVGTYAVEWGRACRNNSLIGCRLHDLGAGGVKIGEGEIRPDGDGVTRDNRVENCRIYDGGMVHPAAIGVWIGQSPGNKILHNDIYNLGYTGVSVGWTWGYGPAAAQNTQVSYNAIHDIGRGVLSDMGGIYTLGNQQGSVVSHNLVHDVQSFSYGGWGIYLDEGSTGLRVMDNIVYGCKAEGFHQHYGKDNVIENNIFACNQEAQLARTRAEDHLSFTFRKNIVYCEQGDFLNGNWTGQQFVMDDNLYWRRSGAAKFAGASFADWQKSEHDTHSLLADPLFANPQKEDFRLSPSSPAISLGIQPIDLVGVGAAKPLHKKERSR